VQLTALETAHVAVANASAAWLDALGIAERAAQAAVTHLLASRSQLSMAFLSKRSPAHVAAQLVEEAHDLARGEILRSFPHHAVIGRHEGDMRPPLDSGAVWLVDALDGASLYQQDKSGWSVTLALAVHGKLKLGIVIDGNTLEIYRVLAGLGLQVDRVRQAKTTLPVPLEDVVIPAPPLPALMRTSATLPAPLNLQDGVGPSARRRFGEAVAATIFPAPGSARMVSFSGEFGRASKAFKAVNRVAAPSLALAQVATGRLDAFWVHDPDPCDMAAGWLLLDEAGAGCRARDGLPWHQTRSISACSPALAYDFHPLLAGV
jgi:myo-inositol-1(or 4)-monophosphatase